MRKPSELGAGFFRVFFGRTGFVAEVEATPMLAKPSHHLRALCRQSSTTLDILHAEDEAADHSANWDCLR